MTFYIFKNRRNLQSFIVLLTFFLFQNSIKAQVFTDSNLPIIIINTDNAQEIPDEPDVFGTMKVIYKGEGIQNYVTDQTNPLFLNYNGRIAIQVRGSSSQALPKKQYSFSTKQADDINNNNVVLLGMPSENDWILNGLAFDASLIRDYLSYNIARNMGNYATRTQYCEVMINGEYVGLYLLQEKIKADTNRVNVTKITSEQTMLPLLSGGYITKCDKTTGGDPVAWQFSTYIDNNYTDFIHELPKPVDVTSEQDLYIHNVFIKLANTTSVNNNAVLTGY
ncbi:MAG: CotH kinase family protein, partial [Methylotenera sp.]|nr:CotH kinase family protein [Flavobacterium sp.]